MWTRASGVLMIGLALIGLGAYLVAFSSTVPAHLRIYFSIVNGSVKIIEANPEYLLPLAGIQPYTQNLTSGTSTLIVSAFASNRTLLNQTYSSIGEGFDVLRTRSLNPTPPNDADVTVSLKLISGGSLLSKDQTITQWTSDSLWLITGVLCIGFGTFVVILNIRSAARGRRKAFVGPKKVKLLLYVVLFAVVTGDYAFLLFFLHYSPIDAIGVSGWIIGIISLALYMEDRFEPQPVFLKVRYVPDPSDLGKFLIRAYVSNEGGLELHSCEVEVTAEGIGTTYLNRVMVEGPRGAVRAEPPHDEIQKFPLLPKRPVWTRGYVTVPESTKVTLRLISRGTEFDKVSFYVSSVSRIEEFAKDEQK